MMKRRIALFTFVLLGLASLSLHAQNVALKTNVLYWATTTPNIGAEVSFGKKHSVQLFYGYNPWTFSERKSLRHWVLQPEYRYWFCQSFNGLFLGVHAMGGEFNVGEIDLPTGLFNKLKDHRYEGWYVGGGVTVGYQVPMSKHWNFEASIGIGYDYVKYDRFGCGVCGERLGSGHKNYFGPTKAALSFLYIF